ncbi:MAG: tetratricopeptide repeat protein [Bacteroidetes bacterium]|nr:tetratricopeptide repeat protein [Bacteroidota bacterium]
MSDLPDSTFIYADKLFHIANKLEDKYYMGIALNLQGNAVRNQGKVQDALEYYPRAIRLFEEVSSSKYLITARTNYALALAQLGQVARAKKSLEEVLLMAQKADDHKNVLWIAGGIAGIYYMINDYPNAVKSIEVGIEAGTIAGDVRGVVGLMSNIGYILTLQGEYFRALDYLNKGLQQAEKIDSKSHIALILGNIGNVHSARGDHELAQEFYRKTLETLTEVEAIGDKPAIMYDIANHYQQRGNHEKAVKISEDALRMAQEAGITYQIRDNAKILATSYRELGKYKEALAAQDIYLNMVDSLRKSGIAEETVKKDLEFDFEKRALADSLEFAKEQEIQQLTYQANLNAERNKQYGLHGGIGLLLVLGGVGFRSFQNKKKDNAIILAQKAEVEEAHKEITDSIHYAKRIQAAVLPPDAMVKKHLPGSFVLYKPKDIVAGDFYWLEEKNGTVFFAAADCTGHGVPGAMVSVVCVSGLNRSLREMNIVEPGKILDKTREPVVKEFEKSDENVQDGMDIALCSLKGKTLQYAGAHNPLWIVRNGELIETKADKQPIGKYDNPQPYATHTFELQSGDTLYIFSDGYPDQFGGEKGKKYKSVKFKQTLIELAAQPIVDQKELLDREFESWKGNHEQIDDVCVVGLKV